MEEYHDELKHNSMFDYDLIILTTAVNRPEVHSESLPPVVKMIKNHNLKIKWIFNIDKVTDEVDVDDTISNLENMCESFSCHFLTSEEPCFFDAVKRLVLNSRDFLDKSRYGVLYLEDDWNLKNPNKLEEALKKCDDNSYVQLTDRSGKELSFNPSFWGKAIFKHLMIDLFDKHDKKGFLLYRPEGKGNPERFVSINFQNMKLDINMDKIDIWSADISKDLGRKWMRKKGLTRWFKPTDKDGKVGYKKDE
jgi:hypothetical protein